MPSPRLCHFAAALLCLACGGASADTLGERLFDKDLRDMQRQSRERERQVDQQVFGAPEQRQRQCAYVPVRGYLDDRQKTAKPGWQTVYVRQCR